MALVAASSSSSAQSLPKEYDVFISFRGEDTRSNFTSHLYDAFRRKHIRTYIDYQLRRGDDISQSLLQAIQDSYISVVVFSENYDSSRWCLDELTHILHCKRVQGQIVVPVFYNVEPTHVRNQTGNYKQAFERYEGDHKFAEHKIQMWKQALHEAASLAGYDSHTFRDESELIQNIVKDILHKLNHMYPLAQLKGLVGIDDNCAEIELLLRDAKTIGIWGMGGIGKSTIAKTIFFRYSSHYEGCCFLENVREESGNGLAKLRRQFLSCLLNEDIGMDTSTTFLESRLSRMKVFVVLDDISTVEQLEYLVGEPHCFGRGSKILITTRDKHGLISKGVDVIYKVKELQLDHSYKLFNLNAFNTDRAIMGYEELTKGAVGYAKGVPLALKVLGSYLCGKSEVEWGSVLRKLEKSPHDNIQKLLRLSYDGLNQEEKRIFLDIACFLKGELTEFVINLLDSFGFHGAIGIRILHDKALINVDDDWHIKMHDLIQEMGLQIVREESIDEPEGRSRLWDSTEIYDVLGNNVGSSKVEGIKLDVYEISDIHLEANVFKKMPNLRYLKFHSRYLKFHSSFNSGSSHVHLPNGLKFLPNKMRYLEWHVFPLKSLCSTFCPKNLVKLFLPDSHLQKLWNGVQDLVSLQEIDLGGSKQLQELPDLSKCLNLKVVQLSECKSLCYVHSSILSLHSLVQLNLFGCEKLRSLKSEIHLKSLENIDVDYCWNLKEFSLSSDKLRCLKLNEAGIESLHSSIGRSIKLDRLHLTGSRLVGLPNQLSCLTSLTMLKLYKCEFIDDLKLHVLFNGMLSLRIVILSQCCNIIELPNNTKHLLGLKSLTLSQCRRLFSLPELPPSISILEARYCESLEIVPTWRPLSGGSRHFLFVNCMQLNEQSLHNIVEAGSCVIYYISHENMNCVKNYSLIGVPGSIVPKWFKYRATQSSVVVKLPQIVDLVDFFYCVVIGFDPKIDFGTFLGFKCYLEGFGVENSYQWVNIPKTKYDHVYIWNDARSGGCMTHAIRRGKQQLFANINLCFKFTAKCFVSSKVMIKECGVWPVYVLECEKFVEKMEMERKKKRVADIRVEDLLPPTKKLKNYGVSQSTPQGLELELGLATAKSKKSHDSFICHPLQLKFISKMKEKDPLQLNLNVSTSKLYTFVVPFFSFYLLSEPVKGPRLKQQTSQSVMLKESPPRYALQLFEFTVRFYKSCCRNLKEFLVSSEELQGLNLGATGIEILHSSVARSSKVKILDLRRLRLVDFPNQLSCLTSVIELELFNCEFLDDSKLHILFDGMLSLRVVELGCCNNIIEFPNNAKHILGLVSLRVFNCRRFHSLAELPPSIARLDVDDCKSLEIVPNWRPLCGGEIMSDLACLSFLNCVQLNEQLLP
ncbi:hypothetical protein K1719_009078 [Acacia pycnantha]|nr:hypothetical protein K1719_009078 [Acacia pycnantha]